MSCWSRFPALAKGLDRLRRLVYGPLYRELFVLKAQLQDMRDEVTTRAVRIVDAHGRGRGHFYVDAHGSIHLDLDAGDGGAVLCVRRPDTGIGVVMTVNGDRSATLILAQSFTEAGIGLMVPPPGHEARRAFVILRDPEGRVTFEAPEADGGDPRLDDPVGLM